MLRVHEDLEVVSEPEHVGLLGQDRRRVRLGGDDEEVEALVVVGDGEFCGRGRRLPAAEEDEAPLPLRCPVLSLAELAVERGRRSRTRRASQAPTESHVED
jgi:hypothetical protein